MNKDKRLEYIKALALIAGSCRDEDVTDFWAEHGMAPNEDGTPEDEWNDFYTNDEAMADIMYTFLLTMKKALIKNGIACDGVVSG